MIKNECESRLFGLVTIDSVCAILQSADLHSAPTLKERCFDFIAKNSDQVVSCDSESAWAQFEAAARPELLKDIFYRLAAKVKKGPNGAIIAKISLHFIVHIANTTQIMSGKIRNYLSNHFRNGSSKFLAPQVGGKLYLCIFLVIIKKSTFLWLCLPFLKKDCTKSKAQSATKAQPRLKMFAYQRTISTQKLVYGV